MAGVCVLSVCVPYTDATALNVSYHCLTYGRAGKPVLARLHILAASVGLGAVADQTAAEVSSSVSFPTRLLRSISNLQPPRALPRSEVITDALAWIQHRGSGKLVSVNAALHTSELMPPPLRIRSSKLGLRLIECWAPVDRAFECDDAGAT